MLTVFHCLHNNFQLNPPDTIQTAIADGMFILNSSTQTFHSNTQMFVYNYVLTFMKVKKMLNKKIAEILKLSVNSVILFQDSNMFLW